jgi:hypothetical protein
MSICKFCAKPFSWGNSDGKWVPLVPLGEDAELVRSYQDENGALRAEHRLVCVSRGGPTVRVSRLAVGVRPGDIIGAPSRPKERIDAETGEITLREPTPEIALRDMPIADHLAAIMDRKAKRKAKK